MGRPAGCVTEYTLQCTNARCPRHRLAGTNIHFSPAKIENNQARFLLTCPPLVLSSGRRARFRLAAGDSSSMVAAPAVAVAAVAAPGAAADARVLPCSTNAGRLCVHGARMSRTSRQRHAVSNGARPSERLCTVGLAAAPEGTIGGRNGPSIRNGKEEYATLREVSRLQQCLRSSARRPPAFPNTVRILGGVSDPKFSVAISQLSEEERPPLLGALLTTQMRKVKPNETTTQRSALHI